MTKQILAFIFLLHKLHKPLPSPSTPHPSSHLKD
jgi:hypothetical protein